MTARLLAALAWAVYAAGLAAFGVVVAVVVGAVG